MNKKLKGFVVTAKVDIECDRTIEAETLEDAIEKARTMSFSDFVESKGEVMDANSYIKGVFEN